MGSEDLGWVHSCFVVGWKAVSLNWIGLFVCVLSQCTPGLLGLRPRTSILLLLPFPLARANPQTGTDAANRMRLHQVKESTTPWTQPEFPAAYDGGPPVPGGSLSPSPQIPFIHLSPSSSPRVLFLFPPSSHCWGVPAPHCPGGLFHLAVIQESHSARGALRRDRLLGTDNLYLWCLRSFVGLLRAGTSLFAPWRVL